jgi:hypothetical protein
MLLVLAGREEGNRFEVRWRKRKSRLRDSKVFKLSPCSPLSARLEETGGIGGTGVY